MDYQHLIIERDEHVATVYFNRSDKLNALNWDLMNEIETVAHEFNGDEEIRAVIFTGRGTHFSAGFDLTDSKSNRIQAEASMLMKRRSLKIGSRMIRSLYEMDQITIAAINGVALGGAACIATACDFRIGAENCWVGYPEVNLAMNLSWGALPLVVHLIGPARAKRMVILANKENAETLLDWGFLDEIVPEEKLITMAKKMARTYAGQPPVAAQMVKRSVNAVTSALDQAIMHMDTDQFLFSTSGQDFKEGVEAFFQNRTPLFKGN